MRSELMEEHESGEHDLCQQQESVLILASICHNSQKEMTSFFFLSFAIYSRQSYKTYIRQHTECDWNFADMWMYACVGSACLNGRDNDVI